jgi:hypothetical protein
LTIPNAHYLARQRAAFLAGTPGPDFPGGKGESAHIGRPNEQYARENCSLEGLRAFGLERRDIENENGRMTDGEIEVLREANEIGS